MGTPWPPRYPAVTLLDLILYGIAAGAIVRDEADLAALLAWVRVLHATDTIT